MNTNKDTKLYYSIREVAEMVGVNESTLRYWETEFPQLRPKVTQGSRIRQYTERDIEEVRIIYNLIKVRGFKIAAAKKYMRDNRYGVDKSADLLQTLINVRDELKALRKQLDSIA